VIEIAVARVHGLRPRMLGRHGLVELAAQPDLAARLELLRRTGHLGTGAHTVREAAKELRTALARDTARLDRWLGRTRAGVLLRAVAGLRDGWTISTILRGVTRGEPASRLLPLLLPTLELDEGALRELARQRSAKAVADLLVTWGSPLGQPLREALARGGQRVEVAALETALHRFLIERALAAADRRDPDGRIVVSALRGLIDLTNAATLLKVSGKAAARDQFLPGGAALPRLRFERLAALGTREVHAALASDRALRLGAAFVDGRLDPFRLDRMAQVRLVASLRRAAIEQPLSVAVPLLYLLERHEEARAIRLVLEAGDLGLAQAEILDLIELVSSAGGAS
jgi:vacuolar-type H+-ATPase subunit C/Vma6